jgi:hypothetical protein
MDCLGLQIIEVVKMVIRHEIRRRMAALGDGYFPPCGMETALAFFIGFGWIKVVVFVGELMLVEIILHLGIGEGKDGADLE